MALPDGLRQVGEGIIRCLDCGGEVVRGARPDGTTVLLTPVQGVQHVCDDWLAILAAVLPAMAAKGADLRTAGPG